MSDLCVGTLICMQQCALFHWEKNELKKEHSTRVLETNKPTQKGFGKGSASAFVCGLIEHISPETAAQLVKGTLQQMVWGHHT